MSLHLLLRPVWLSAFVLAAAACSSSSGTAQSPLSRGVPVEFSLAGLEGEPVDARAFRGRLTVILFATTFDISSQAQARRLEELAHSHSPRLNAVLVVLEPAKNVDLVRSFRDVLELTCPIAMADPQGLSGQGLLGRVTSVPTWLFLDRDGRALRAVEGQLSASQLEELTDSLE